MNHKYRNVAFATSGAVAVAVAATLLRKRAAAPDHMMAQTMTVAVDRDRVLDALSDGDVVSRALGCDHSVAMEFSPDRRTLEWFDSAHPHRNGRLAFIDAPGDRGTELHLAMRGAKYDVKDVVRKIKALIETGEIPTGERL
ncbi:MAG: hypothetical protein M3R51_06170 [Candidatus Eremiobacteraeota bacterium]|nr:hypothetical protein [Candidatus Eremiobacteraeota bacterium]